MQFYRVLASAQHFFQHPAFFEDVQRCIATPDQEIQLPEWQTYFIIIVGGRKNTLEKESSDSCNSTERWPLHNFSAFGCFWESVFRWFLLDIYQQEHPYVKCPPQNLKQIGFPTFRILWNLIQPVFKKVSLCRRNLGFFLVLGTLTSGRDAYNAKSCVFFLNWFS